MRKNVTAREISFRKAWLQSIVDRIEVGADVIRIIGDKTILEAAVIGAGSSVAPSVRSSAWKWRTRHDSNV
ncbi:serine acetyltransferase [Methylorubrum extorquens]|nr:serine acetyltransferase [Methylorubrum extorquens]MDF9861289.1 serine acetyltransferase [Methylorubrum pseudosasae]